MLLGAVFKQRVDDSADQQLDVAAVQVLQVCRDRSNKFIVQRRNVKPSHVALQAVKDPVDCLSDLQHHMCGHLGVV